MPRQPQLLLFLVVLISLVLPSGALATERPRPYIVVLKEEGRNPSAVVKEHERHFGARPRALYAHALKGYAATIPTERVSDVRRDGDVAYVVPDVTVSVANQQLPWGMNKIDAERSSTASGDGRGAISNVRTYVVDTGVDKAHPDLNVVEHLNFAGGRNADCHGHGTQVAGTLAAKDNVRAVVSAAPRAPVTALKVLGCDGSGSASSVIKAVDWITAHARRPAVANLSLSGSASRALDDAVRRSAARGIFYAVAAGNDSTDACRRSPARAGAGTSNGIATVAATTSSDREASFSNFGPCVDLWAPGVQITSTRRGGGMTSMSGTSMASPHVAGGGALKLSGAPAASPSAVEAAIREQARMPGTRSRTGRLIRRLWVRGF